MNLSKYVAIEDYFVDVEMLIDAIHGYRRISNIQRGEYTLADLLR